MRVLAIILTHFFIREISAYNIKSVKLPDNRIIYHDAIIRFDAEGNTYFGAGRGLYRINASDEIDTIEGEFRVYVRREHGDVMVASSRGDVFMIDDNTLRVVKAGSRKSEKVAEDVVEFHLDNNDNLFYVIDKKHTSTNIRISIYVIRPNSAVPFQILNSTDFRYVFPNSVFIKSDKSGNIYMPMHFRKGNAILVLTNETLKEEQPVAKYINITETEAGEIRKIHDFMIDEENNLWILYINDDSGVVMK